MKRLIFSNFNGISPNIKEMKKTALARYEEIANEALDVCRANLRKSFKSAFILTMILYMILSRKINLLQSNETQYQNRGA